MSLKLDLSGKQSASLGFKAWYQIEEGYDYARVLVNGQPIAGNLTTSNDPNRVGFGIGITGNSNGWTDAEFDLTPGPVSRSPSLCNTRAMAAWPKTGCSWTSCRSSPMATPC